MRTSKIAINHLHQAEQKVREAKAAMRQIVAQNRSKKFQEFESQLAKAQSNIEWTRTCVALAERGRKESKITIGWAQGKTFSDFQIFQIMNGSKK